MVLTLGPLVLVRVPRSTLLFSPTPPRQAQTKQHFGKGSPVSPTFNYLSQLNSSRWYSSRLILMKATNSIVRQLMMLEERASKVARTAFAHVFHRGSCASCFDGQSVERQRGRLRRNPPLLVLPTARPSIGSHSLAWPRTHSTTASQPSPQVEASSSSAIVVDLQLNLTHLPRSIHEAAIDDDPPLLLTTRSLPPFPYPTTHTPLLQTAQPQPTALLILDRRGKAILLQDYCHTTHPSAISNHYKATTRRHHPPLTPFPFLPSRPTTRRPPCIV